MIMKRAVVLNFMQARDYRVRSVSRPSLVTMMRCVLEVVADIDRCAENTCPRAVIYQIRTQKRDY